MPFLPDWKSCNTHAEVLILNVLLSFPFTFLPTSWVYSCCQKGCQQQLGWLVSHLNRKELGKSSHNHGLKAASLDQIEPTSSRRSFLTHDFSNLTLYQNYLEGLLKHRLLGPPPQISEPAGLSWSLNIFLSNKSPVAANAAGLHLENHCLNQYQSSEKNTTDCWVKAWVFEPITSKRDGRTSLVWVSRATLFAEGRISFPWPTIKSFQQWELNLKFQWKIVKISWSVF